jgi:hypothetical protein
MKKFILKTFIKVVLIMSLFSLYGEYVISRELNGALQLLSTFLLVIVMATLLNSIYLSFLKLKNQNK